MAEPFATPYYLVDEALLRRAVDNLLRNSVRHNPGQIQLSLRLSVSEQQWCMTVQDNGSGLPEDVLQRLRRPQENALPSHGLGLVLVQQIVRAHGGTVCFENTQPGLKVTLSFPRLAGENG